MISSNSANMSRRGFLGLSAALMAAGPLTACGASGAGQAKPSGTLTKVSVVLDWTPNTNHTGVFVAQEQGLYAAQGLEVEVKGYSQAGVEAVLAAGGADFGFSYGFGLAAAAAAKNDLQMIFNLQPRESSGAAVRADSKIMRPRDLDGKIWAAGGAAEKGERMKQMIIADGGKGEFQTIIVGTGAYAAVVNGQADFAEGLTTWEGIEFEIQGTPLRFFYPGDYGIESSPCQMGLACSSKLISEQAELVQKFVTATKAGYDYVLANPDKGAEILVKANPQANIEPELAKRSQEMLAKDFWPDNRGATGLADLKHWQEYLDYLVANKMLTDENGQPFTGKLSAEKLVTNQFVS